MQAPRARHSTVGFFANLFECYITSQYMTCVHVYLPTLYRYWLKKERVWVKCSKRAFAAFVYHRNVPRFLRMIQYKQMVEISHLKSINITIQFYLSHYNQSVIRLHSEFTKSIPEKRSRELERSTNRNIILISKHR